MNDRCWIVSPMLNDTESFLRVRAETRAACETSGTDLVFVVVDDSAGTDPDVCVLDAFDDVEVIVAPFNLGHQRAIVYALRLLVDRVDDSDMVVTMDSDGEDQPSDVPAPARCDLRGSRHRWPWRSVRNGPNRSHSV